MASVCSPLGTLQHQLSPQQHLQLREEDGGRRPASAPPLPSDVEAWERDVLERYPAKDVLASDGPAPGVGLTKPDPNAIATTRSAATYRDYSEGAAILPPATTGADAGAKEEAITAAAKVKERVKNFYKANHTYQTYAFATARRDDFLRFNRKELSVWEAFEFLNTLVDESDPDTDLDQFQHLLQTSEAIRRDGHPDWMVLVGLMHDLGKVLCLFGEPQWAVVGDTFPVGCAFSDKIVFSEFFAQYNPDAATPPTGTQTSPYATLYGVYAPNCGLRNVTMSWGHDEYIYHILKDCARRGGCGEQTEGDTDTTCRPTTITPIPEEGLYMLRYHSFYAWHKEGQYTHLMDDHDTRMLPWVQLFNPYDLYSKCAIKPDWAALRPYYEALVAKYLPPTLRF